jgi:TolB-like protein
MVLPLVLLLAVADPAPPAAAAPPTPSSSSTAVEAPVAIDEGAVVEAVEAVLDKGRHAVRVAVPPVSDTNAARQKAVELVIVRAILDRRREEAVTPAFLRAKLAAQGEAQLHDIAPEALKPFACDHVLLASVVEEGGAAVLHLKLVHSESGEVLGDESADLGEGKKTSASAQSVRNATDSLVEQIAFAVESGGEDIHLHRIAVSPLAAEGAAKESRLDQFLQSELIRSLKRRGFLVVERAQLSAALNQLALGQVLDEKNAPQAGKALGAQSLVVGSVNDAGTAFAVAVRVVNADSGKVVGGAAASLPRDDVVSMAQVETRTPLESMLRSVVAPGWGQSYNGDDVKALAFGVAGYGALAATAGIGVGDVAVRAHYADIPYFTKLAQDKGAAAASQEVLDTRHTYEGLDVAVAVAGAATAVVWTLNIVDALISAPAN